MMARHDTTSRFFFIKGWLRLTDTPAFAPVRTENNSSFSTFLSTVEDALIRIFGEPAEDPQHHSDGCEGEFPPVFAAGRDCHQHRGDRNGHDTSGHESSHKCFVYNYWICAVNVYRVIPGCGLLPCRPIRLKGHRIPQIPDSDQG